MKPGRIPGLLRLVALLVVSSSAGIACLAMLFDAPKVKSEGYIFASPPPPWRKIDAGTSDLAYQQPVDHSTISLNSVCGQYQDQTLEDLTKSVSLGLTDSRVVSVEKLDVEGFPALRTNVEGKLQSVPVTVSLTVLRSNQCVYDFMLVARSTAFPSHQPTYAELVLNFKEGPRP
jgi:hypothetical protein